MVEDLAKGWTLCGLDGQQPADEVLQVLAEVTAEVELSFEDLFVLFEGDVTAHHVK